MAYRWPGRGLTSKLTIKRVMREFADENGRVWVGTIQEEPSDDYKGRFYFVFREAAEAEGDLVSLTDVRWNSERTAERTLRTMSDVELRRRLRSARGRSV
ncbi:MAG: hypothetical protein BMS9Abin29_0296 [Gemmatimonadota bacterium]|nr:MAG: hypothetical protein BMS9Abin29_0296 [Gemmatimonadota bacterium]